MVTCIFSKLLSHQPCPLTTVEHFSLFLLRTFVTGVLAPTALTPIVVGHQGSFHILGLRYEFGVVSICAVLFLRGVRRFEDVVVNRNIIFTVVFVLTLVVRGSLGLRIIWVETQTRVAIFSFLIFLRSINFLLNVVVLVYPRDSTKLIVFVSVHLGSLVLLGCVLM